MMRATIELIIRDDKGEIIGQTAEYELNLSYGTFSEIEQQVEQVKQKAMREVNRELLKQAQERFIQTHPELIRNGHSPVQIKGLHGRFEFEVQWFKTSEGKGRSYFDLSGQFREGYQSEGLKELVLYYSNRLSYGEVSGLVKRMSGERLLSDQKIEQLVVEQAAQISRTREQAVQARLEQGKMPTVKTEVALYDREGKEILLFEDGILVKEQKEQREPKKDRGQTQPEAEGQSRVSHHIVLLEKKEGGFEYLTELKDSSVTLAEVVQSQLIAEYGAEPTPLNLVAITDGASNIRQRLLAIFGVRLPLILDWYHLDKKVHDLLSMIARTKTEKEQHLQQLLSWLWHGQVDDALTYLKTEVVPRQPLKLTELTTYLDKHRDEIIDYDRRQQAGKTIGSGRVERGCDLVVGHRQKKKGMSWSETGSKALAILKTVELNGRWSQLWSFAPALT
jgi:hypothetical protein